MKGQFDPQEMIDKMVEVIGADNALYRNAWPPAAETLMKQVDELSWTPAKQVEHATEEM